MFFVPVMGRRGPGGNPEYLLGPLTAVISLLSTQFQLLPGVAGLAGSRALRLVAWLVFLLALLPVLFSSAPPYTVSTAAPATKRLTVLHVLRGEGGAREGGLKVCSWDHRGLQDLAHLPAYRNASPVSTAACRDRMGCGLPAISTRLGRTAGCSWLPTAAPRPVSRTELRVVDRAVVGPGLTNISLEVTGPARCELVLSTPPSARLHQWSVGAGLETGEVWGGGGVAMLRLQRGGPDHSSPHRLWVVVQGGARLVAALSGHHTSGPGMYSPELRQFLSSQPAWVSPEAWVVEHRYYSLL